MLYVGLLAVPTVLTAIGLIGYTRAASGFPTTVVLGAVFANLAYFLGPAVEVYAAWLGFRHRVLRVTLFVLGTLFALALTLTVLSAFVMSTF